ncbi:hypothetical protein PspLS_10592 [Pyricularia sp. CBS 133598]|nr:hypothetical protein PspLS_10592 [Pyricularia sp. CBS 133598]
MSAKQIIPLHSYDSMPLFTSIVLTVMLKYDRVLDPQVLRDAMVKLIDREGWRKLGSRLKRDAKGEPVYHVPAAFDQSCPAITFSHVHHDTTMAEHPVARLMTSPKEQLLPTVVVDPAMLAPLARRADAPRTMRDFIDRALPQVELHVVTFRDGTAVSVSCLHSLLDAMGLGAGGLLGAWSLVLRGRGDEVPPVCGVDRDLLRDLTKLHLPAGADEPGAKTPPAPEFKNARYMLGPLDTVRFVLRRIWELVRYREEARMVRVPGPFVTGLREAVLERLATAGVADSDHGGGWPSGKGAAKTEKPWVSEGDVLVAWWRRYATLHLAGKPDKPVVMTSAFSMRKVLAGTLLPLPERDGEPAPVYLANCASGINSYTTVGARMAETAAKVRRSIVELGTVEQVAAMHALCVPDPRRMWKMRVSGPLDAHTCIFSNWSQGLFYQIDLSPAVVSGGEQEAGGDQKGQVMPSFVVPFIDSQFAPQRDQFFIIGKDGQGDYWISGGLRKGFWTKVEEELGKEKLYDCEEV